MDIDVRYLAGFFDADGCITARWNRRPDRPSNHIEFIVAVSGVRRGPIDLFATVFGGTPTPYPRTGNRQETWRWHLVGRKRLARFVEIMENQLLVKEPQLVILKRFLVETRSRQSGSRRLDPVENERRAELCREVWALNQRGKNRNSPGTTQRK